MNRKLWHVVERFCRGGILDESAFRAFGQLVESDQEAAIRRRVQSWSEAALEQLSLLMSGTLDTVGDPGSDHRVLQCRGLYLTGPEASLLPLGKREIPVPARKRITELVSQSGPHQTRIILGSRIVPVTWVHGFSWKQWRAGLARDDAMFTRPCKAQPRQAPESQAWILPVFIEKEHLLTDLGLEVSADGVSEIGRALAQGLTHYFQEVNDALPSDLTIHPILAAAHCCWANAKTIAVYEWAQGVQAREQAAGRSLVLEERPHRGAVQARDAETKRIVATLQADASFPVDGTGMAIQLLMNGDLF